jgi:hypothetical protein
MYSNKKRNYCKECRDEVSHSHRQDKPGHVVFHFGANLTKPKPEQFKFRSIFAPMRVPTEIDLSPNLKLAVEKGILPFRQAFGDCTANCGAADKIYQELIAGTFQESFSRSDLYANERIYDRTFPEDAGSMMETIGIVLGKQGICLEHTMPYDNQNCGIKPNAQAIAEALQWTADVKQTRLTWNEIPQALYTLGPVRLGIPVPQSFVDAGRDGFIPPPDIDEEILGGHAVLPLGTTRRKGPDGIVRNYKKVLNSWDNEFGDALDPLHCFYLPDEYGSVYAQYIDAWIQLDSKPGPGGMPTPTPVDMHLRLQKLNGKWQTLWQI